MNYTNQRIVLFLLLAMALSSCHADKPLCELREIKTLYTIPAWRGDEPPIYGHTILLKGIFKDCMDSTMMVNIATRYRDTVSFGRPANVIRFYSSDKRFIPYETSQVFREISKDCLVIINFSQDSGKVEAFWFFDADGDRTYCGNRWMPSKE